MKEKIERYYPTIEMGLTEEQIQKRKEANCLNYDTSVPTKSIKRILFENFFTLFNFLNLLLGIAIFSVGSYKNMLFLGIAIVNTAISTIQEIHSKRVVDKLSILNASKVRTIRNGNKEEISIYELVLDDMIEFHTGNQIPTDCIIQQGTVLVNESFITGEPDSITKKAGDMILSGSYLVSGKCFAKVEHIGEENYTAKISSGAKYIKKVNSEIMSSLRKIIRILTFAIIPIGCCLFFSQLQVEGATYQSAVVKSVAAMIGMIPEGLVLLTSTVLAVSVIRLSKARVLVQELYCIETLARVDTLCLDKTGTLTEGSMEVKDCIPLHLEQEEMSNILANFATSSEDENATIQAIKSHFTTISNHWIPVHKVAFNSQSKWSGIQFKTIGSYVLGAPEFVLQDNLSTYQEQLQSYTEDYRVLVLAHSNNQFEKNELPKELEVLGFVLISDKIRTEAKQTLSYFKEQGVAIKIISGDNPITVSKIAKQVGVENYENYLDMSTLPENTALSELVIKYTIFGRVSPTQKKDLVEALQQNGKTVAMTGDGVNDVLALKASDCSIALANGSDATKNVSQLVLLDSNFASMPKVVAEGRRTINNIQRSASLFLVKTIYSTVLALLFIFMGEAYPFMPIQLSLISVITIGVPSFLLALEPNKERIKGNFLKNVISKSIPTGITVVVTIFALTILNKFSIIPDSYLSSLCVISTGTCGLLLLFTLTKSRKSEGSKYPFSWYRLTLAIIMAVFFLIGLTYLNWFFAIAPIAPMLGIVIKLVILAAINFIILNWCFRKLLKISK